MKWLKKKIVKWLLKDLDELKTGKGTIHITKDYIDLAKLTSDPEMAEGRLWYNASEKALKFSDGTEVDGFDLRLSQLRDDLRGVDNRTLTDIYNRLRDVGITQPLPEMETPSTSGTLIGLVGIGGRGGIDLVYDETTCTVTETTWTQKKRYSIGVSVGYPIFLGIRIDAYIDTAGEELHIRVKNRYGEVLLEGTWTETSSKSRFFCFTTRWFGFPDADYITIEAYVTGGTGYITLIQIRTNPSLIPVMGWTYSVGSGFYLRPLRVDTDGWLMSKPDLATLKQAQFPVVQKIGYGIYGVNPIWEVEGTPIPAYSTKVPIDVSGSGHCYLLQFYSRYSDMWCRIYLDGSRISLGHRETPKHFWKRLGSVGREGLTELVIYDTTNNKYYVIYHLSNEGLKTFQSSLKVEVYNPDSVEHKACVICNYALLSSPEIRVRNIDLKLPSLEIRKMLAKELMLHHRALTVDQHVEWDEKLKRNVKVLSIMNHTEKEEINRKIIQVLNKRLKIRKDGMEVIEY